jgi:signal transduction histidine kinase
VLDNLVHNACYWLRAVPEGNARRLLVLLDPGQRRVLIADSGPGVHDEAQEHLFQPFFSMKAGGTGLGLYISREIMHRMSGSIGLTDRTTVVDLPSWATGAVFVLTFAGHTTSTQRGRDG